MSTALRSGLLMLVGVLLLQSAWVLAVPPFRGSDEVDHAFRAAGAATGQLHLGEAARDGRGMLVWVPTSIARAAEAQCASLSYPGPDNCHPVEIRGGQARIATAAGGYDPIYYFVVGTAARPFGGSTALYAMRIASALICALMFGLGAGLLAYAGAGRWTTLGIVAALMPEVAYSTAMTAPDGPEMAIGFLLWASLLSLTKPYEMRRERLSLSIAIVACALLAFTRQLGPLWIVAILVSAIVFLGWARTRLLVFTHRWLVLAGTLLVFLATCWWGLWPVIASHYTTPADAIAQTRENRMWILAFNLPAWIMQMVGVFPYRDQPMPLWVYPLLLTVILFFLVSAFRVSRGTRHVKTVLTLVVAALLIPVGLSILFMPTYGAIWQGRYELVYCIGILPVCGLLMDRHRFAPAHVDRLTVCALTILVIGHVYGVFVVMHRELARHTSTLHSGWVHPPLMIVLVLALAGVGVLALLAWRAPEAESGLPS